MFAIRDIVSFAIVARLVAAAFLATKVHQALSTSGTPLDGSRP
jgi:hypothetical protein